MSAAAGPISPQRFAEAIQDLPVGNLHLKAAEIQNSIAHLQNSNDQLQDFADEGDADCAEAIQENRIVIQRMEGRILLLRSEVEKRGLKWGEDNVSIEVDREPNGDFKMGEQVSTRNENEVNGGLGQRVPDIGQPTQTPGGSLGDDHLAERLAERMDDDEGEEDGLHL